MKDIKKTVGWTSAYLSSYPTVKFTQERRSTLVDRIRKRQYNFTHADHQFLDYAAPFYEDEVICVLTKQEWDSVISDAYKDNPLGTRLMPEDVIDRKPINGVLYEREKWEPKE
jgi:hypothetical protein